MGRAQVAATNYKTLQTLRSWILHNRFSAHASCCSWCCCLATRKQTEDKAELEVKRILAMDGLFPDTDSDSDASSTGGAPVYPGAGDSDNDDNNNSSSGAAKVGPCATPCLP